MPMSISSLPIFVFLSAMMAGGLIKVAALIIKGALLLLIVAFLIFVGLGTMLTVLLWK